MYKTKSFTFQLRNFAKDYFYGYQWPELRPTDAADCRYDGGGRLCRFVNRKKTKGFHSSEICIVCASKVDLFFQYRIFVLHRIQPPVILFPVISKSGYDLRDRSGYNPSCLLCNLFEKTEKLSLLLINHLRSYKPASPPAEFVASRVLIPSP